MTQRELYCFGESGNAYKCALTLQVMDLPWTPVFVDFFNGAARAPAFRALNPMGEVPVLVEGGRVLTQSAVIQLHLAESTSRFGGQDRDEVLRWLFWDNHKLSGVVGQTRFLMNFLPPEKRPAEVIRHLQGRLKAAYGVLEAHLQARDWIEADAPSIADFACCAYLYYPEPFGFDRTDWPSIAAWLDRIAGLPGWAHPYDLMPGQPSDRGL